MAESAQPSGDSEYRAGIREDSFLGDLGHHFHDSESSVRRKRSSDSLVSLSEKSECYSEFEDISEIILQAPLFDTQPTSSSESIPAPTPSSVVNKGKRKAGELSEPSSPRKPRPKFSWKMGISIDDDDDDDPFIDRISREGAPNDPDAPVIIAYSPHQQKCIEKRNLPYGVQYEIARLVSMGRLCYDDIMLADLDKLRDSGPNASAAPVTAKILLQGEREWKSDPMFTKGPATNAGGTSFQLAPTPKILQGTEVENKADLAFAKEVAAKSPWLELDREEEALSKNPLAGLGFSDEAPEWYGGKILFRGKLKDVAQKYKAPQYSIVLEHAELGPSCRFTRRFGSKCFLRVNVSKSILTKSNNGLIPFFCRPFVLAGKVFRAFYAKDNNVFLVKTNELMDGWKVVPPNKSTESMSFLEFLNWHNPIELNSEQTMAKWAARFALGLSNSAPGIRLQPSDILVIPDIVSPEGSDMTDGAGDINKSGIRPMYYTFSWHSWPTAVQCRVAGAKGLLVQHPSDDHETPRIWLRPSQIKIKYSPDRELDPAMLVVDLLRSSHSRTPSRLSVETIVNLAENGVPKEAFITLLQQGLQELITPLVTWDGPAAMRNLWAAVARVGGVISARLAREEAGEARVRGYADREADDIEIDDEDGFQQFDLALHQRSSAWWSDQISGCPSSLEETVMYLLESGFTPQNLPVLREKLETTVKSCINRYVRAYRIEVPMSVTALIVPDTQGILEPGEVYFKSSKRNLKMADGLETDIVIGDILITRHPCKLPTDIQKWKAVDRPELRHHTDVIIFSIKGPRRPADMLAGGDYDGDKGLLIYQPELVKPFRNAPPHFSVEPSGVAACFSCSNERVPSFLINTSGALLQDRNRALQQYLLGALNDTSLVGKYSVFHDTAIYTLGYTHPETIRLAYMFCKVLDASKTGLTVLPDVLSSDTRRYQKRAPEWKEAPEEKERLLQTPGFNENYPARPSFLSPFIMDQIFHHAKKEGDYQLGEVRKIFSVLGRNVVDADLTAPWLNAQRTADRWAEEEGSMRRCSDLNTIAEHVHLMYAEHRQLLNLPGTPKKPRGAAFTDLPIEVRQDNIRALSKRFASLPLPSALLMDEPEVAWIKASYAYLYDSQQNKGKGWTRFPWDVAMRELCHIKARALGPSKTITGEFHDKFVMKTTHF